MQQQIELFVARLERANTQLEKMLSSFNDTLTEAEINEILDEILKNKEVILKLRKDLQ